MGKENSLLLFYEKREHFADLVNGWIFGGESVISPQSLEKMDRRTVQRESRGGEVTNRYKDIVQRVDAAAIRVVIGTELQSYIDYLAPIRSMDYDLVAYREQIKEIREEHKEKKDLKRDEFLTDFGKNDKLTPVITLFLYMGDRKWDAAEDLHALLKWDRIPAKMRPFIENYRTHVLDVYHTTDRRLLEFPGDMGYMFLYLKHQKDKNALKAILEKYSAFRDLAWDVYETLAEYTDTPELLRLQKEKGGGKANMCEGLREWLADTRDEGKAIGYQLKVISMVCRKYEKGKSAELIAEEVEEPLETIQKICGIVSKYAPTYDVDRIYEELQGNVPCVIQ
ncbi:MAG: Rpn family recombination-promoting nuclease/putative transposase [Lachnospiraceae bacterium]|nr:Rpn family recombination-promoting nuclease/putative transposase [Lachnospiraceae bacterium]